MEHVLKGVDSGFPLSITIVPNTNTIIKIKFILPLQAGSGNIRSSRVIWFRSLDSFFQFLSIQIGIISGGGVVPFFIRASGFPSAKKICSIEFCSIGAMNMNDLK